MPHGSGARRGELTLATGLCRRARGSTRAGRRDGGARRPQRPNSFRSRTRTPKPRARRPPMARRSKAPRTRSSSKTRDWTTPLSSKSRRKATRTSPTSSATSTTRRRLDVAGGDGNKPHPGHGNGEPLQFSLEIWTRLSRHRVPRGAIAQLGERLNGIQEVGGSNSPWLHHFYHLINGLSEITRRRRSRAGTHGETRGAMR